VSLNEVITSAYGDFRLEVPKPEPAVSELAQSLDHLTKLISLFDPDQGHPVVNALDQVASALGAQVVVLVAHGQIRESLGLTPSDRLPVLRAREHQNATLELGIGILEVTWLELADQEQLLVGRLGQPFSPPERELVAAFGRTIQIGDRGWKALTAERQAHEAAVIRATHDSLTGLPNREMALEQLGLWLKENQKQPQVETVIAVLFIDLDRFKNVNDAYGHVAGDQFLITVARILQQLVGPQDILARLAGDEFIVICRYDLAYQALKLAEKIISEISIPINLGGRLLSHSASIGLAYANPRDTADSLLENADLAMYEAKQKGRHCVINFDHGMRESAQQRTSMESELRRALANGELECYFQPIMELWTNRISGFEALVRWIHPQQGLLNPADFIPIAEETGLIVDLDAQILEQACKKITEWNLVTPEKLLTLSVNISARSLLDLALSDRVASAIKTHQVQASNLYLEITETALIDDIELATTCINKLESLGVRMAIDDFGTGYSSLRYLKNLQVGVLKIDRSFTDGLSVDHGDGVIVKAVIDMASALNMAVVAEGIETQHQLDVLKGLGCEYGQGYLFGRPLNGADTDRLLKTVWAGVSSSH
jgi:diguanylate cyclase (GGDEF)-like protein